MPSTFTQSGVELIGDGEQSGTWGTTTNTNLQIIDRMVSQAGAITLSGTTHTLTISDGILSDGQYGVLVFGGSPSGTNTVTISPNDAQRTYIAKNDSGESVVLTQGSGGNVTVADGKTAIVYCDGAGSGAAVVDLTADLAVTALTLADFGITASAAELNILDGVTATTAELNILDGVTADATELNLLAGVTGTLVTTDASQTLTNKTMDLSANTVTVDGTNAVGYRGIPQSGSAKTTSYSLATGDVGELIVVGSGGSITIPDATFSAGDAVVIANNTTGDITITCTITTAYIGGTDTDEATVTLATRGICNVLFLSGTACIITGNVS